MGERGQPAGTPDPELGRARGMLRRGQVAQAEAVLRAIVARRPDDADALYALGSAAAARGDRAEALRRVGAAVERRLGEATFHTMLGTLLVREERIDEGRSRRSAGRSPSSPMATRPTTTWARRCVEWATCAALWRPGARRPR
ncbi:MAG: tetratricopeptide repeat protein [Alphaproteobacteria bacterium]|nr:tetratricopeptide repeat protein [Alphaproteobacteria bacterium]